MDNRNPLVGSMLILMFIFLPTLFGTATFEVAVWAGMTPHWAKGPGWVVGIGVAILQVYAIVKAMEHPRRW